jgi:hypothetical protein
MRPSKFSFLPVCVRLVWAAAKMSVVWCPKHVQIIFLVFLNSESQITTRTTKISPLITSDLDSTTKLTFSHLLQNFYYSHRSEVTDKAAYTVTYSQLQPPNYTTHKHPDTTSETHSTEKKNLYAQLLISFLA